jgi:hypothetical protein
VIQSATSSAQVARRAEEAVTALMLRISKIEKSTAAVCCLGPLARNGAQTEMSANLCSIPRRQYLIPPSLHGVQAFLIGLVRIQDKPSCAPVTLLLVSFQPHKQLFRVFSLLSQV